MSTLSVVMASLNDQDECLETIRSIRQTAGDAVEIVVVDDCSGSPYTSDQRFSQFKNVTIICNMHRCGCGPSRHLGAMAAKGEWLLICDSHMRFEPGWFEAATAAVTAVDPRYNIVMHDAYRTVWCATCIGLDRDHMDMAKPASGPYYGATFNFHGPDRQKKGLMQTLECVWLKPGELDQNDGAEIPAVMGAAYFVSRQWFLHTAPTLFLRTWGGDELMISMKSWMAGGSVRLLRNVRIGHRFPVAGERKRFGLPPGHAAFNKVMAAHTLFPAPVAKKLVDWVLSECSAQDRDAAELLTRQDWHIIAQEGHRNRSMLFTRSVDWLCSKFQIPMP